MSEPEHVPEVMIAAAQSREGEPAALPLPQVLEGVDHGIALTDAAGRVRWCNTLLAEVYLRGRSREEWVGRDFAEVFHPLFPEDEQWARVEAALARLRHAPKERIEIENLALNWGGPSLRRIDLVLCDLNSCADDEERPPVGSPEGPSWVAWYFYDLTAFRKTQENLQALLRHTSDGIFMLDADCRLRVFNEACERITGFRAEEVLHQQVSCSSIFPCFDSACEFSKGRARPDDALCFKRSVSHQTEERNLKTRDGRSVWIEISYAPVTDREGHLMYVLGILRDISQRRQLEEQLRLTRKLATLGELTSAMAHEIKNPLGIILSAAEIISNPARPEEQRRQAAEFIRDETKRLDERIRTLLNFSRPHAPDCKGQSVHRVLGHTILAYETLARPGLTLRTRFTSGMPFVRIDADQMQQVFLNLIMNADQAMPAGGTITIATRYAPVSLGAAGEGGELGGGSIEVSIADEGPGLNEQDRAHLFEPFFSTKPSGTGLGLPIVLHIVSAHHGTIEARNRTDRTGAEFIVRLPAVPPDLPADDEDSVAMMKKE